MWAGLRESVELLRNRKDTRRYLVLLICFYKIRLLTGFRYPAIMVLTDGLPDYNPAGMALFRMFHPHVYTLAPQIN